MKYLALQHLLYHSRGPVVAEELGAVFLIIVHVSSSMKISLHYHSEVLFSCLPLDNLNTFSVKATAIEKLLLMFMAFKMVLDLSKKLRLEMLLET